MPSTRGYRGVAGQPVRPYPLYTTYVNTDIWLNLTFLDRFNNLSTPTTVNYRVDSLTTNYVMLATTSVTPTGPTMVINIPASINYMYNNVGQSSQTNQVTVTAGFADGSQVQQVFIYELVDIQIADGSSSP